MGTGCSSNTSISVEEVKEIQKKVSGTVSEKDIKHWHKGWKKISSNGKLTKDKFITFITENDLGTVQAAKNMFKMMDVDGNGVMEFDEFVVILALPESMESVSAEQFARLCITIYDEDNSGTISKDELLRFAITRAKADGKKEFDEKQKALIEQGVKDLYEFIDTDADGEITEAELISAIERDPNLKNVL